MTRRQGVVHAPTFLSTCLAPIRQVSSRHAVVLLGYVCVGCVCFVSCWLSNGVVCVCCACVVLPLLPLWCWLMLVAAVVQSVLRCEETLEAVYDHSLIKPNQKRLLLPLSASDRLPASHVLVLCALLVWCNKCAVRITQCLGGFLPPCSSFVLDAALSEHFCFIRVAI